MTSPIRDSTAFIDLDIGHETDTTLTRTSAGRIAIEGEPVSIGETFDVRAYGADGTDDEVAIEAAITAAAVAGGTVFFPPGAWDVDGGDDAITVPSNVTLKFAPGATLGTDSGDGPTVTINGDIESGNHQIFLSTVTIDGAPKVDKFNVTWWGAVADGTDSTAAITACLATAADISTHASGISPTIYFPPVTGTRNGYYMADVTLTEAFHVVGYGAMLSAYSADDYAIDIEYASGTGARTFRPCVIEGLTIWGYGDGSDSGAADSSNGIRIDLPSQHTIIKNCVFNGTKTYGVHKVAGYGVNIEGCLFITGDYGYYAETDQSAYPPTINRIVDCEFNSFTQSGIFLGDGADLSSISHCVIQSCKGNGITLADAAARGSYRGVQLNEVWMEQNGVQNLAPVATIDIDGVTIEPVDLYVREVTNLTLRHMRIPVTWLKSSHMRTYDCGYSDQQVATGRTNSVTPLDNVSTVIHHNLSAYRSLAIDSDQSHVDTYVHGIRIQEVSTGTGSTQAVSVVTPHKTELDYLQTNLLGTDASCTIDFTPNDDGGETEDVAAGSTPCPVFNTYWTTTVSTGMDVEGVAGSDYINLFSNIAITETEYHVWSIALCADGANLTVDMSWAGALHRPRNIRLSDGVWKTVTGVWGQTNSATPDLRIANTHATNSGSLRISAMQLVSFTSMQLAMEYANSNRYAMGGVTAEISTQEQTTFTDSLTLTEDQDDPTYIEASNTQTATGASAQIRATADGGYAVFGRTSTTFSAVSGTIQDDTFIQNSGGGDIVFLPDGTVRARILNGGGLELDDVAVPTVESASVLLSTTTVALNANAQTTLYTVPAGKRCILHKAILVAGADAGTSDISIGQNGATTDFVGVTNLDNVDAQYDACVLAPVPSATPATLKSYAATTVIEADVANQAGGATNTVYLYGMLY